MFHFGRQRKNVPYFIYRVLFHLYEAKTTTYSFALVFIRP